VRYGHSVGFEQVVYARFVFEVERRGKVGTAFAAGVKVDACAVAIDGEVPTCTPTRYALDRDHRAPDVLLDELHDVRGTGVGRNLFDL
jgi:hypothetical protein